MWNENRGGVSFAVISGICVLAAGLAAVAQIVDSDGDGIIDQLDNCSAVSNPAQCDADADGYGNTCDADYTQDFVEGPNDYLTFRNVFMTSPTGPPELGADHDCDGAVATFDFVTFNSRYLGTPGPSGLICAGQANCGGV